ncbi:MAG: SIS domain-containing protein [Nitrososphaerota archaeon]|jgi:D-sedoheptulose 7-phosphate isomerase|nr:SIS domain-containing protein [Nitrososphaerota archaeon]
MFCFFEKYKTDVNSLLEQVTEVFFSNTVNMLINAYKNDKQIFIIGNGGSAAIANHFSCDLGMNSFSYNNVRRFRFISLCANSSTISAIANDKSFTDIFRQQLINLLNKDDVLFVISASGKSENLVNACVYAKEVGAKIITMSGFSGGYIKEYADVSLCLDSESYGTIEDVHHIILHALTSYFKVNQQLFIDEVIQQ